MAEMRDDLLILTSDIVSAYLTHNAVRAEELPDLIRTVRATLREDAAPAAEAQPVSQAFPSKADIRRSIRPEALISFVDGKPYKTLNRHLARHGMDMAAYREQFGLPKDYPSTAADHSARRSELAHAIGLGARGRGGAGSSPPAAPGPAPHPAPAKKGRRRKTTPAE